MNTRRNILTYVISDLLGMGIGILTSPLTTRLLTQDQYGASPSLTAVWVLVALLAYGGMETSYEVFRAQSTDQTERTEITITTTVAATFFFFMVWGVFFIFSVAGTWLQDYAHVSRLDMILFLMWLVPFNLLAWYLLLLRFTRRFAAYARVSLIGRVVAVLLAIPALIITPQNARLSVWFLVQIIVQFIGMALAIWELNRSDGWPYRLTLFSWKRFWKMLPYGLAVVPGSVIYGFADVADRIMTGWLVGPAQVAIVTLALSIRTILLIFSKWFGFIWDPYLVDWLATKDPTIYIPRLQQTLNGVAIIFFGLTCIFTIWIGDLIRIVYPVSYLPTIKLVPFLAIAAACFALSRVANATYIIAPSPRYYLFANIIGLTTEIVVGLLTIPVVGALGAALCTMAQELSILIFWLFTGKTFLKNLLLDWQLVLLSATLTIVFVGFYIPGSVMPSQPLLERVLATIGVCLLPGVYMLTQRKYIYLLIKRFVLLPIKL